MKSKFRKTLTLFLAITMVVSVLPVFGGMPTAGAIEFVNLSAPGITSGMLSGGTTIAAVNGLTTQRRVVTGHPTIAAISGTHGWSSGGGAFNAADYRSAFNGSTANFFDGYLRGHVQVEFIEPQYIGQIRYMARSGQSPARLNGAVLEGSNDGVNYDVLFTLDGADPGAWTTRNISHGLKADQAYRFFRVIDQGGVTADMFNIVALEFFALVVGEPSPSIMDGISLPSLIYGSIPLIDQYLMFPVTWVSKTPDVMDNNGNIVWTGELPVEAILEATLDWDGHLFTKEFTITIGDPEDFDEALIANFPLRGNALDVSGNGHTLNTRSGTWVDDALFLAGGARASNQFATFGPSVIAALAGQNSVTYSMWINSNNEPGNFTAFYYGRQANLSSNTMPSEYVLLVPSAPDNRFKAVMTNSNPTSNPWTAEVGPAGMPLTAANRGVWTHYAITITPTQIMGFINGERVGTANKTRNLSQFGGVLEAHLGASNYMNDGLFSGHFRDVYFYSQALTDEQMQLLYRRDALDYVTIAPTWSDGDVLPTEFYGVPVTWEAEDGVSVVDGKIVADYDLKEVTLIATFGTRVRHFTVVILPTRDAPIVYAYVNPTARAAVGYSMHLALQYRGEVIPLNFNEGILFAPTDWTVGQNTTVTAEQLYLFDPDFTDGYFYGGKRSLENPWVFLMADGRYGVVAQQRAYDDILPAGRDRTLFFWTTENLVDYDFRGILAPGATEPIIRPQVEYDDGVYYLTWEAGSSIRETSTTFELLEPPPGHLEVPPEFTDFTPIVANSTRARKYVPNVITGVSCMFEVTQDQFEFLMKKLLPIENIGADNNIEIEVMIDDELTLADLPRTFRAYYSDTSEADMPIIWDENILDGIDTSVAGRHTVTGRAAVDEYPFPFIRDRADPTIILYEGYYYFIATFDGRGSGANAYQQTLRVRKSETLMGLADAPEHTILPHTFRGTQLLKWAPEFHMIDGRLSILFATGTELGWNRQHAHIMQLRDGGDPTVAADWYEPEFIVRPDGRHIQVNGIGLSIDMTILEHGDYHYYIWSQRLVVGTGTADHYIAKFDPANPAQLTTDPVLLSRPNYGWERSGNSRVQEGAFIIRNGDRIFMTYSGAHVDHTYCVGLMEAIPGADLMHISGWRWTGYPILTSAMVPGEAGPGHNAYVRDEFGRYVNVYHAFHPATGGDRHTGLRTVHWAFDGTPVLYMTPDRQLLPEYRLVTLTIIVTAGLELTEDADNLKVTNIDNVRSNLYLSEMGANGSFITWESSDPSIITTTGEVTRPAYGEDDVEVLLTASISNGLRTLTREFNAQVKAMPRNTPFEGYLLAYFTASTIAGENIYKSVSTGNSPTAWTGLRNETGGGILFTSELGERGLRDPFIIRSPEGDTFYMIATDLSIGRNGNWTRAQTWGSLYINVWESHDLVNWSDQRQVQVSPATAGNTWAPEAFWDESIGAYVVFWASCLYPVGSPRNSPSGNHMMFSTTRDFVTFSEPQRWMQRPFTTIDTTVVKVGDMYYRFTKNEDGFNAAHPIRGKDNFIDRGPNLRDTNLENWEVVGDNVSRRLWRNNTGGDMFEGAVVFRSNPGDPRGEGFYYMADHAYGEGYRLAFLECISDINNFTPAANVNVSSWGNPGGTIVRHGTVINITEVERRALLGQVHTIQTTTALELSAETIELGQTLTLTAQVTAIDGGQIAGDIEFSVGEWSSVVRLADGQAAIDISAELALGENQITARYLGLGEVAASEDVKTVLVTPADVVDKTQLEEKIAEAELLDPDDYPAGLWADFAAVLAGAKEVFADAESTQEEVQAALVALTNAIEVLEGKTALGVLIAGAPTEQGNYTLTSWTAMQQALVAATIVLEDPAATPVAIGNANATLQAAIAGLTEASPLPEGLILDLTFDNNSLATSVGMATAVGTISYSSTNAVSGSAATFNNNAANYITLANTDGTPLLRGLTEYTVSFWVRPTNNRTCWWWYAAPNANTQTYNSENYTGIFTNTAALNVERYIGGRYAASSSAVVIPGVTPNNTWSHITVTYGAGFTTVYRNGRLIGSQNATGSLASMLGQNPVAFIGRANWGSGGEAATGQIDEFKAYNRALDLSEIVNYFASYGPARALEVLDIPTSLNDGDVLPETLGGFTIVWVSSDPDVLADGYTIVSQDADRQVTLTATIEGQTRTFNVTVQKIPDPGDLEINITYIAQDRITLVDEFLGASVTWASAPPIIATSGEDKGAVTRPEIGAGDAEVTLTATIIPPDGEAIIKVFEVTVAEADFGDMLSFITYPSTSTTTPTVRTAAASKAIRADGAGAFTVLNNDKPFVYTDRHIPGGTDFLRSPSMFRHPDGRFGLIAGGATNSVNTAGNGGEFAYIYDTDDLVHYGNERRLRLNTDGLNVRDPFVVYDNATGLYSVYWRSANNNTSWHVTVTDLTNIISVTALEAAPEGRPNVTAGLPQVPSQAGVLAQIGVLVPAREANAVRITRAEYDYLRLRKTRLHNTGVAPFEPVTADEAGLFELPAQATLIYNDGTTKPMGVIWDADDIAAITGPGEHTVTGIINQQLYEEPLVRYRADPNVFLCPDTGYYYFTGSYPTWAPSTGSGFTGPGYDRIILRRSKTVQGLGGTVKVAGEPASWDAYNQVTIPAGPYNSSGVEEITIWHQAQAGNAFNRYIWAPEIQKVGDIWVVFFTASTSTTNVWTIRPAFLVNRGDPWNPADWNEIHRLTPYPGDPHNFGIFSLDMTYFEAGGNHYVTWTHKPGNNSTLAIARCHPERPWELISPVTILHQPTFAWEWEQPEQGTRTGHRIAEAQAVIQNDGIIYMAFSGATVDHNYSIGMITAREGDDLLNPDNWHVARFPSLATADLPAGQSGPGHNQFTIDADGNPIIVYHARHPDERNGTGNGGLDDPGRHAFVKPVQYNIFGDVIFYMTPEEELNPELKNVEITVIWEGDPIEPADYGAVNAAIEAVEALDRDTVRAGLEALDAAVDAVIWNLPNTRQDEVDAFAAAINEAFDALLYWEPITQVRIELNAITRVARNTTKEDIVVSVNETAKNEGITLTVSNPAMATIGADGRSVITGTRAGTVTLTATAANGTRHSVTLMIT